MPRPPDAKVLNAGALDGDLAATSSEPPKATEDVTSSPLISRVKPQMPDRVRDASATLVYNKTSGHSPKHEGTADRIPCFVAIRPINLQCSRSNVPHARMGPPALWGWFRFGMEWKVEEEVRHGWTPPIFWISHP